MTAETEQDNHHPRRSHLLGHVLGHAHAIEAVLGSDRDGGRGGGRGEGRGRRHHGFIFSGAKGIGKATSAYRIAERLLTSDAGSDDSRNAGGDDAVNNAPDNAPNNSGAKLVRAGTHPDLLAVEADATTATASISVDHIRQIIPFLAHKPALSQWRVVIIDALDEMNINGANAILKTLEEPPPKTVIMMIHHRLKPVLPTIRSRAQSISMAPLAFEQSRAVIQACFPEADASWIEAAAALSDGAPGLATRLAASGAIDIYTETCQMLAAPQNASKSDLLSIDARAAEWGAGGAKNLARRQMGQRLLVRFLATAARQATQQATQHVTHPQQSQKPRLDIEAQAIAQIARRHSPDRLAEWHQIFQHRLDEASRLNLDTVPIFYDLLECLTNSQ